jgi:hypothetical protein
MFDKDETMVARVNLVRSFGEFCCAHIVLCYHHSGQPRKMIKKGVIMAIL